MYDSKPKGGDELRNVWRVDRKEWLSSNAQDKCTEAKGKIDGRTVRKGG